MQWIDRITMIFIMNNKVLIHVSLISVLHREERLTMLDGELSDHRARPRNIPVALDVWWKTWESIPQFFRCPLSVS
jgi:hypothetical protein